MCWAHLVFLEHVHLSAGGGVCVEATHLQVQLPLLAVQLDLLPLQLLQLHTHAVHRGVTHRTVKLMLLGHTHTHRDECVSIETHTHTKYYQIRASVHIPVSLHPL